MSELNAITLTQGEVTRFSAEFSPNLILTHLRVAVVLTDRRVIVRRPNTIFGLVPLGYLEQSSPIEHISEFDAGERISTKHLFYGAGAALFGLLSIFAGALGPMALSAPMGLVLLAVAAYLFLTAHSIGVLFRNHGSGVLEAPAGRNERHLVEQARSRIDDILFGNGRHHVTPQPPSSGAITPSRPPQPIVLSKQSNGATASSPAHRAAPEFTSNQASDPNTPRAVLYEIAQRAPSLRPQVAANPNTYPGLLDWLAAIGDPEIDRALASRQDPSANY